MQNYVKEHTCAKETESDSSDVFLQANKQSCNRKEPPACPHGGDKGNITWQHSQLILQSSPVKCNKQITPWRHAEANNKKEQQKKRETLLLCRVSVSSHNQHLIQTRTKSHRHYWNIMSTGINLSLIKALGRCDILTDPKFGLLVSKHMHISAVLPCGGS